MARTPEGKFQDDLITHLNERFPGCFVLVKPGYYVQGFPDLLVLYKNHWAALEVKKSLNADYEPNQEWWIAELDTFGFASMICPENCKEILDEVQRSFEDCR